MTCSYCQFSNSEDDHRCGRCGRRLTGTAVAAPPHRAREHAQLALKVLGANALAAARHPEPLDEAVLSAPKQTRNTPRPIDSAATLDELPRLTKSRPAQPSLFSGELQPKIIQFETYTRPSIAPRIPEPPAPAVLKLAPSRPSAKSAAKRREHAAAETQATLDFLPPAKNAPRTLKTSAEAVIFCDAAVAAPTHRATAAVLDLSMIVIAFGTVLATFELLAAPTSLDSTSLIAIGLLFALTGLFYGLLFAVSGAVTPGMRWTNLRLINFDGFPPDGRSRALRFIGSWISFASGGLGIVWALLDEENLTWHDHMSKTFPTSLESESVVARHRGPSS